MSRFSDYARQRGTQLDSSPFFDPFEGFSRNDPYDRHSKDPWYRHSSLDDYGDGHLRIIPSHPFMSELNDPRLSERCVRGYNPPYYGKPPSTTGSDPFGDDYGFAFEDPDTAFGTPMGNGYAAYKEKNQLSDLLHEGFEERRKRVSKRPPRKMQTEEYFGNPSMIRRHHREMYDHASSAADAARNHHEARAQFDEDYRFHYKRPEDRRGHLKKIDQEREREAKLRMHEEAHREYGVDYYYY